MKYAILILTSLFLSACGSDSDSRANLPATPFQELDSYELSDFNLSSSLDYWEIVRAYDVPDVPNDKLYQFDADTFDTYSDEIKEDISEQSTNSSFVYYGDPSGSRHYGVTLEGAFVDLVISKEELVSLFGEIDTEAELNILMWANRYEAKLFEQTETGFRTLVEVFTCDGGGELLLEVTATGDIQTIRTVTSGSNGPGVC